MPGQEKTSHAHELGELILKKWSSYQSQSTNSMQSPLNSITIPHRNRINSIKLHMALQKTQDRQNNPQQQRKRKKKKPKNCWRHDHAKLQLYIRAKLIKLS